MVLENGDFSNFISNITDVVCNIFLDSLNAKLGEQQGMTKSFENVSICTFQNNSIFDDTLPNIVHFLIPEMSHLGDQQNMLTFYLYVSIQFYF